MACFVTFEGPEGSGKTTQVRMVAERLKQKSIPYVMTEEPGGTPMGVKIREVLLNCQSFPITPLAELFLFQAARCQHVETIIRPALQKNKTVICDRFTDATVAYQGAGRGLDKDIIHHLNSLTTLSLKPDKTFLFDIPVAEGIRRALDRMNGNTSPLREDRFENEALQFHQRVRDEYLLLAQAEPKRFIVVDATKRIEELHHEIWGHLSSWIKE
jgi:dTMP kinase